jgi:probable F420-dependent oxidoreductase
MKFGLMFTNSGPFSEPEMFAHLIQTAEHAGFESIWVVEHVVIPKNYQSPYPYSSTGKIPGPDEVAINDPLVALGFAAALTQRLRLATGILILPQRHPLYVAKELATVDVLSRGRAILGVGSGWLKEEFEALGLDFASRGSRTDEAIEALHALWRDDPSNYHGRHFNFSGVASFPKPVQNGGIPIHVGGHSPAAVRRAARFGVGFFPALGEPEKLRELFDLLTRECKDRGRRIEEIELSCLGKARAEMIRAYENLGISRVVVTPPALDREGITRGLEKIANEFIARS